MRRLLLPSQLLPNTPVFRTLMEAARAPDLQPGEEDIEAQDDPRWLSVGEAEQRMAPLLHAFQAADPQDKYGFRAVTTADGLLQQAQRFVADHIPWPKQRQCMTAFLHARQVLIDIATGSAKIIGDRHQYQIGACPQLLAFLAESPMPITPLNLLRQVQHQDVDLFFTVPRLFPTTGEQMATAFRLAEAFLLRPDREEQLKGLVLLKHDAWLTYWIESEKTWSHLPDILDDTVIETIHTLAADPQASVRALALSVLASFHWDRDVPAIETVLADRDEIVRQALLEYLLQTTLIVSRRYGLVVSISPSVQQSLRHLAVEDANPTIRLLARRIAAFSAEGPALLHALEDPDPVVVEGACHAQLKMSGV